MKVKSLKGKTAEEIKTALQNILTEDFKPSLALVFISADQERETVCAMLDKEGISIFGATTSGEFIDDDVERGSIVIILFAIDPAYFKISLEELSDNSSIDIAYAVAELGMKTFSNPGFIIAIGGRPVDGTKVIAGIQDKVGVQASIFGGLAGNVVTGTGLFVFDNNQITDKGLIALIIDNDKIDLTGFATSGWQPIATFHTITKSEHNTAFTIDDEPAMDMIAKYTGANIETGSTKEQIYSPDASPIQLYRDNAPSVLREITFFNGKTRAVSFAGPVPKGSKFRFSLPPDFDIVEKIKSDCEAFKEQHPDPDALIVFSCASRLQSLGPMVKNEIEEIKNTWDCPIAGFFCFGEIGKYPGGETEFHNNTCSIVLLKEK